MEISKIILGKAIEASRNSTANVVINELMYSLESKSENDILFDRGCEVVRTADNKICETINRIIYVNNKVEAEKVNELAEVIFTAKKYLKQAISDSSVKHALIFLSVNCYLKIDIKDLLQTEEELNTTTLSENIRKILSTIKLETSAKPDAPYHEKRMLQEAQEGLTNGQIEKVYHLIESLERGGRGFHFNFVLENLIDFLYQINFTSYVNEIASISNPQTFVFYLQSSTIEKLVRLANEKTLKNKWLSFEIIRQIIKKEPNTVFEMDEQIALKNSFKNIANENFYFLKQTIQYFHRSLLFNGVLGESLVTFSNTQIKEIFNECLPIDKSDSLLKHRDILLEHFSKNAADSQYKFLLQTAFEKWKTLLFNISTSDDSYQDSLLLTDFANFIIHYYAVIISFSDLVEKMKKLVVAIKFIDAEWMSTSSQQITKFHLYYTELYLLSFAYKNKNFDFPELKNELLKLENDRIQVSRYFSSVENSRISEIAANLIVTGYNPVPLVKQQKEL